MNTLFNPQSIAIVGASADKQKIGAAIMQNLINAGYQGKVIPINPKYDRLFGAKSYASLSAVKESIDLVVVAVPAVAVQEVAKEAIALNIPNLIVISAGFAEIGAEGADRESSLVEMLKGTKTRLLGPNCLGIIATKSRVNASFAAQMPKAGNIAFLSQSGAFNTAMLDMAAQQNLGFAYFISVGNMADISEVELVQYWLADPSVEVIGMYLEEFSAARKLMELVQNSPKPVVILHPGDSESAQAAMASHTGSLAGNSMTAKAAIEKANMIQVSDVTEMFNTLSMLSWLHHDNFGSRIGIVTNAGGPGIVATDIVEQNGMQVVELSQVLQNELKEFLPAAASAHNPVDLLGDARADRYESAMEALSKTPELDALMVLLTPQYMTEIEETAQVLVTAANNSHKYILPIFLGGEKVDLGIKVLHQHGLAAFKSLAEGVKTLGNIVKWQENRRREKYDLKGDRFVGLERKVILNGGAEKEFVLPYLLIKELMQQVGIVLPEEQLVDSKEEALEFARRAGYPIVIKATADQVLHKTDQKAIFLNLQDETAVCSAFDQLFDTVKKLTGRSDIKLLIQRQLQQKSYLELFLGATRSGTARVYDTAEESGFGHLMVFGQGGIYTEVYKEVSAAILPLNHAEIEQIVSTTKVFQIIKGVRGQKPLAMHLLVELIGKLQLLLMTYPEIKSLDINPVFLNETECLAMDVKIIVG